MRKITKEEIEELFKFVKSKYVHHFDVQCELVDHLACAIEEEWEVSPNLTFESALATVYSRFPITGFTRFVEEQASYVSKYWLKMMLKSYRAYFTSPLVFLTILIYYMIDGLGMLNYGKWMVVIFISSLLILNYYSIKKIQNKYNVNKDKFGLLVVNTFYAYHFQIFINPVIFTFDTFEYIPIKIFYTIYLTHLFVVNHYLTPEVENKLAVYAKKLKFHYT